MSIKFTNAPYYLNKKTSIPISLALLMFLCIMSVTTFAQSAQTAANQPNIVYILLDDVGFADLGPYGSEISTPSIDRLAQAAMN